MYAGRPPCPPCASHLRQLSIECAQGQNGRESRDNGRPRCESPRLVELRAFVSRLLGWSNERLEAVDLTLRAIRTAATRRSALVLCGDGDLVAIACGLHRRTLGDERPFVVCDPRRRSGEETVRFPENYDRGIPALEAAAGGTLCVWAKRLPRDFGAERHDLRVVPHP